MNMVEQQYITNLNHCEAALEAIEKANDLEEASKNYLKARKYFKTVEPILSYVDVNNYKTLNQPNLLNVDEEDLTDIKIKQPEGFQVLEEWLFIEDEVPNLDEIKEKAFFIRARIRLIRTNTDLSRYNNKHFLGILRDAIVRIATTGITGYDSPALSMSLEESAEVYTSLKHNLVFFKETFEDQNLYHQWRKSISKSIDILTNGDFENFDRYMFIKENTHPQLALIKRTIVDWGNATPPELALSYKADNLFSAKSFNRNFFKDRHGAPLSKPSIDLGKKLFYDKSLSSNGSLSCSSCHQPQFAFSDGQRTSIGANGIALKRNSPTLLYAGFQKAFFYDGRAGSLEGQIVSVVKNKNEFHTSMEVAIEKIKNDTSYSKAFSSIFKDSVTDMNVRNAIANYVRSLSPFNSKFDQNIRGELTNLSQEEIRGFNLFMGKAACATCHFPPLFNGLLPTRFKDSELESIGVPETAEGQKIDNDLGRYEIFKTEERKHFFKTPTVRNIALTGPYMHNGIYDSLSQVMDFYNAGGGTGLGYKVPNQTLPTDSLQLTNTESNAIISFLNTLTDEFEY